MVKEEQGTPTPMGSSRTSAGGGSTAYVVSGLLKIPYHQRISFRRLRTHVVAGDALEDLSEDEAVRVKQAPHT